MSHKKDARANAAEKIAARDHLSEQPSLPASDRDLSQLRFPGETPLTGEDRPLNEAGSKREAYSPTAAADHAAAGHLPTQAGDAEKPGGARELPAPEGADYQK